MSTSYYKARTVAERVEESKKSTQRMQELAEAYRERTGQHHGLVRIVDFLPEPDAALVAQNLAERAARRQARLAERPHFIPISRRSWDELTEEALAEVNLAYRALTAARRIAGESLSVRYYANEHGGEDLAEAAEQQWLADEQAWLSAEEVFHEVLVKHSMAKENESCAPTLWQFDPGTQKPHAIIDTGTSVTPVTA